MELARTVPSTEVLRDIENQVRHLYAVSARLAAASVATGELSEGMFIGRGLVVEAPHTGDVVKVVTYASLSSAGVSALRHIA